jgi:hypothetical protein
MHIVKSVGVMSVSKIMGMIARWVGDFELELDARPAAAVPYRVSPPPTPSI